MKDDPDKCHLLLSENAIFEANINENRISNTRFENLCVTFDNQFNLNYHISKICKTASNKISNVNYNLSGGSQFHHPSANTVWNGQEAISYSEPEIWNVIPERMK